jgi:uncharacterized protein (TIGR00730 family)
MEEETPPRPVEPDREAPLPERFKKEAADDRDAHARIERLITSPSYVLAERDLALLGRDEATSVRLLLEYLKPQIAFAQHDIRSTIVLFGGTRIVEAAAAQRRIVEARAALEAAPDDADRARRLRVTERVAAKSHYYDLAREFARLMSEESERGDRNDYVIVTGGGPGIMEAGNRGAFDVGAKSAGLNITLPHEQYPNPYISPELCFQFRYFALRKMHFLRLAVALVAFPGGFGTLDEIFDTLCLIQTRKMKPVPVILVGETFWRGAFSPEFLAEEGVVDPEDVELISYAETAEEIRDRILGWYAENRK